MSEGNATDDERTPEFEVLEQELFKHQPVLSMNDGSIAGCQCMDRVFHKRTEDWGTHLAEVFEALRRTAVQEPSADHHVDHHDDAEPQGEPTCCDVPGGPERCGDCPLDREPQGEPSDAITDEMVERGLKVSREFPMKRGLDNARNVMRAVLEAALRGS